MAEDGSHRRGRKREVGGSREMLETGERGKISRQHDTSTAKLDLQAWFCFDEPSIKFPVPLSTKPLVFGPAGYMHHVNTTSGLGLELPGSGVIVKVDGRGEMVRRHFTIRNRYKPDEEYKYKGPMSHGIACWHKFNGRETNAESYVICYEYPELQRLNLPVPSEHLLAPPEGSAKVACLHRTLPDGTVLSSSSPNLPGRMSQSCESAFEDRTQSEDRSGHRT